MRGSYMFNGAWAVICICIQLRFGLNYVSRHTGRVLNEQIRRAHESLNVSGISFYITAKVDQPCLSQVRSKATGFALGILFGVTPTLNVAISRLLRNVR